MHLTSLSRAGGAIVLAGLLGLGLAACGGDSTNDAASPSAGKTTRAGDGDYDADAVGFCDAYGSVHGVLDGVDSLDADDPASYASFAEALNTALTDTANVEVPDEIADDWSAMMSGVRQIADRTQSVSEKGAEYDEEIANLDEAFADAELVDAADHLKEYAGAHCS